MLDRDLAELYQVKTEALNQAVKRNIARFPVDFMFQLSQHEFDFLRSQIVMSNPQRGGRRYLPYAFTEFGVAMLSSVLRSTIAVQINIKIIRAFVDLRQQISSSPEYALLNERVRRIEAEIETLKTQHKVESVLVEGKVSKLSRETLRMTQVLDEFQNTHFDY